MYGRLPSEMPQDDDNYSLTHSQENLVSEPSDDSDTFSPVDHMLHVTNNNLDKQGNIIMICSLPVFYNICLILKLYIYI